MNYKYMNMNTYKYKQISKHLTNLTLTDSFS